MAGFTILGTTEPDFYRGNATGVPRKKKKNRKASLERQSRRKKKELIVAPKYWSNIRVKTLWRSPAFLTRRSIHQNGGRSFKARRGIGCAGEGKRPNEFAEWHVAWLAE